MIELGLMVAAVILTVRIARMEGRSSWVWGGIAVAACIGSMFFPYLPFLRVLIAAVLVIAAMMVAKAIDKG